MTTLSVAGYSLSETSKLRYCLARLYAAESLCSRRDCCAPAYTGHGPEVNLVTSPLALVPAAASRGQT